MTAISGGVDKIDGVVKDIKLVVPNSTGSFGVSEPRSDTISALVCGVESTGG